MNFLGIANAQNYPTFDVNQLTVTAAETASVKLSCKADQDDIAIFFESKLAGLDKCRVDVSVNKALENEVIKFVGLLSEKSDGSLQDQLKMKICSRSKGEIKFTPPQLQLNRKYEQTLKTCKSVGDPHVTTFDGAYYSNYAAGNTWLVKSDVFDVQLKQESCYGKQACNTAVAIRFMDNVYVADLANPLFNCHSANKCATGYGVTIQASSDGGAIVKLPGNIEVTTGKMDAVGINVIVQAPGQDASKYATSQCNPDKKITGDVTTTIYPVSDAESYFKSAVTVSKPSTAAPHGCQECQLPVSCDNVFANTPKESTLPLPSPAAATGTEALPSPSAAPSNAVKQPDYGQYTGKKVPTGYKVYKPVQYTPPPKTYVLVPTQSQNTTTKPTTKEASEICSAVCVAADFKAAGIEAELDLIIKGCVSDYAFTLVNGASLAVESSRKHCLTRLQQKTNDVLKTGTPAEQDSCKKVQTQNYLGDTKCQCGENGSCTAFGCQCKPGYGGSDCSKTYAVPSQCAPTVKQIESKKPQTSDSYKLPTGEASTEETTDNTTTTSPDSSTTVPGSPNQYKPAGTPVSNYQSGASSTLVSALMSILMIAIQ